MTICDFSRISVRTFGLTKRATFFTAALLIASHDASAQSAKNKAADAESSARIQQSATYKSAVDERLTIRKITVLPGSDNTDGIYARPLEAHLVSLVKASHRWEFTESTMTSLPKTPLEMEENAELVKSTLSPLDADAALLPIITRGPQGLSLRLNLFLKVDGKILSQEITRNFTRFELSDVKAVGSSRVDLQACKLEYSIVSPK